MWYCKTIILLIARRYFCIDFHFISWRIVCSKFPVNPNKDLNIVIYGLWMTSPKQFIISFHISSMVFLSISIFHDHLITKHKLPWITQRKNHMLFQKKSLQFSFQILNKMLIDKLEHFFKYSTLLLPTVT